MSLFGRSKISKGLQEVKDTIMDKEEILYIHEEPIKPLHFRLVLTNRRIIQYCNNPFPNTYSCIMSWYWWEKINRVWIEENIVKMNSEGISIIHFEGLPIDERDIIYKIAREMKEATFDRQNMQTPVKNLEYITEMLDKKLITKAEHDAMRADILSKMVPK